MCNKNNFNEVMKDLAELKAMKAELEAEISAKEDELKAYMTDAGMEVLQGVEHKATYKEVTSKRVDTKLVKMDYPEIVDKCMKVSTGMRFTFS